MPQEPNVSEEPQQVISSTENQAASLSRPKIVSLCAGGLIICFFLPWISFLGAKPSGFDLAKLGGKALALWSIPVFGLITIVAGSAKNSVKSVAQLTGALPFFFLAYGLYNVGSDFTSIVGIGGYLNLILGLVLFVLARGLK